MVKGYRLDNHADLETSVEGMYGHLWVGVLGCEAVNAATAPQGSCHERDLVGGLSVVKIEIEIQRGFS